LNFSADSLRTTCNLGPVSSSLNLRFTKITNCLIENVTPD
jgi:hypothetical protein